MATEQNIRVTRIPISEWKPPSDSDTDSKEKFIPDSLLIPAFITWILEKFNDWYQLNYWYGYNDAFCKHPDYDKLNKMFEYDDAPDIPTLEWDGPDSDTDIPALEWDGDGD